MSIKQTFVPNDCFPYFEKYIYQISGFPKAKKYGVLFGYSK